MIEDEKPYTFHKGSKDKGSIFCEDKCNDCGSALEYTPSLFNFACPHCDCVTNLPSKFRVHFKKVWKRFSSLHDAEKFLHHLQQEAKEGTFTPNRYRKKAIVMDSLPFDELVDRFLKAKDYKVRSTYNKYKNILHRAVDYFHSKDVRTFTLEDFQTFLKSLEGLTSKSHKDYMQSTRTFFIWLYQNQKINRVPSFPEVKAVSKFTKYLPSKKLQTDILDKVKEICENKGNGDEFKRYLAIRFLSTYLKLRPIELLSVRHCDFDLKNMTLDVYRKKTIEPQKIRLLKEDFELVKDLVEKDSQEYFFTWKHPKGGIGNHNKRFGNSNLNDLWKEACKEFGITNITLYGGTRISSVTLLQKEQKVSPYLIQKFTGHTSPKSFSRYLQFSEDFDEEMAELTKQSSGKLMANKKTKPYNV